MRPLLVLAAFLASPAAADPCVAPGPDLIFSACAAEVRAEVLLLPEDAAALADPPPGSITVTGAYTGTEDRAPGKPKPVGLFIRGGERVSLELGRMDGLLIVGADGVLTIAQRGALELGGAPQDVSTLTGRVRFAKAAKAAGASVLQSHLLISEGALDLSDLPNAPRFRRRVLFLTEAGVGLWDSGARMLTLYDAAREVQEAHAPDMALNLDMGSFDFCEQADADGAVAGCGRLAREGTARLSNLIRLRTVQ